MSETYTHKQVMDKLRLGSIASFHNLKRKYPHAFVTVYQGTGKGRVTLYDKQASDKFSELRQYLKRRAQP